jgi:hypothetical protein
MRRQAVLMALLVVGISPLLGSRARADFIQLPAQTDVIAPTKTDWNDKTSSLIGSNPFMVKLFNPADFQSQAPPGKFAKLEAVAISLTYSINNTITLRFDNVSTINVTATGFVAVTLPDHTTNLVNPATFTTAISRSSNASDLFPKFVPITPNTVAGTSAIGYTLDTNSSIVSMFQGKGTIDLPVFAHAQSTFSSTSGNGAANVVTIAAATISVIYWYSFVPEPSSIVLTGLGGLGLALASVRRARRKGL